MSTPQTRQELANKIRDEHAKSARRFKISTMLFVLVGVLICVAVMIFLQLRETVDEDSDEALTPKNATSSFGFTLTKEILEGETVDDDAEVADRASVLVYEDFLCDSCKMFHEETGDHLIELVESGEINLTFQPFTFLLTQSTDEYSQRAANAAVCVADSAGVAAYAQMHSLLMGNQPDQGGPGLSDEVLLEYAEEATASAGSAEDDAEDIAADIAECIEERRFATWVEEAMQAGIKAEVTSTPTVRINGLNVVKVVDGKELMPGVEEIDYALDVTG